MHTSLFLLDRQRGVECVNLHNIVLHDVRIARAPVGATKIDLQDACSLSDKLSILGTHVTHQHSHSVRSSDLKPVTEVRNEPFDTVKDSLGFSFSV